MRLATRECCGRCFRIEGWRAECAMRTDSFRQFPPRLLCAHLGQENALPCCSKADLARAARQVTGRIKRQPMSFRSPASPPPPTWRDLPVGRTGANLCDVRGAARIEPAQMVHQPRDFIHSPGKRRACSEMLGSFASSGESAPRRGDDERDLRAQRRERNNAEFFHQPKSDQTMHRRK